MDLETRSEEGTLHVEHSSPFKTLLFQVFLSHQFPIEKPKLIPNFVIWLQLLFIPIQFLQVISLMFPALNSLQTTESSYRYIGDLLEVARPDLWTIQTGNQVAAGIGIVMVLVGTYMVHAIDAGLIYIHLTLRVFDRIRMMSDLLVYGLQRYLFLPHMVFFAREIAGCTFDDNGECSELWLRLLSLVAMLGYALLMTARVCFVYESAWFQHPFHLLAHPHPSFELKELGCLFILGVLSQVNGSSVMVLVLCLVLSAYLLLQLLIQLPYYHSLTMHLKCAEYCLCTWASGCGLMGLAMDSMPVVIVLFAFTSPCLCLITAHVLNWQVARTKFIKKFQTFQRYEVSVRWEFARYEDSSKRQDALRNCLDYGVKLFSESKEYYLLLSHYYYYIRGEPELALLRLAATSTCADSFLTDFQVFRFSEMLSKLTKSEERDFVDYQDMYRSTGTLDHELCETTYDLLNSIINRNMTSNQLERSFLKLAHQIKQTCASYKELKAKFPSDPFVLEHFGTFLVNLFYDSSAQELIHRGFIERNRRKTANINSIEFYSSEDTGVLIISCHYHSFGKIIYANDQMGSTLNCNVQEIIGKDLNDFIPPPYNYNHNNKLSRFLAAGEAKQVFRSNLFLSANQKYTVEVTFRFRPTTVKNVPYFVVAVRAKPKTREFVLFDEDGKITSHSQFFPLAIGMQDRQTRLNGTLLEEWLPGVLRHNIDERQPFVYVQPVTNRSYGLMFFQASLGSSTVHWVYLFTREHGIEDLFHMPNSLVVGEFHNAIKASDIDSRPPQTSQEVNKGAMNLNRIKVSTNSTSFDPMTQDPFFKGSEGTSTMWSFGCYAYSTPGKKLRQQIMSVVKAFKISYTVSFLVICIILCAMIAVLYVTLSSEATFSVAEMGASRLHMVRITHYARRLQLIETGLEPKELESGLMVQMQSEITSLSAVVNNYFHSQRRDVFVWNLISEQFIYKRTPLFTALTDFITFANMYAGTPRGEIDSAFFYVYANGIGDLFRVLNSTVIAQSLNEQNVNFAFVNLTSRVTLVFLSLTFAISTILIARNLYLLETYYRQLWHLILNLQVVHILNIMTVHKERIEIIHGMEHIPIKQARQKSNAEMMNPPQKRVLLLYEVMMFVLVSCAFVLFVVLYGLDQTSVILALHGNYMDAVSESTLMSTVLLHMLKEDYLNRNSSVGYQAIVKEGQFTYSAHEQLVHDCKLLLDFENEILPHLPTLSSSPDLEEALFNACPSFNASQTCIGTALAKGQHQAVVDFHFLVKDLSKRMSEGAFDWQELVNLEDYVDTLVQATVLKMERIQYNVDQTTGYFISMMIMGSVLYVSAVTLLFVLVYLPMVNKAKKRCMSLWRVTRLIQSNCVPG